MPESTNAAMLEYWNGPVGERWANKQPDFDRNMGSLTVNALSFADARPGERVLDIGCGFGTTAMALARAVAPDGRVTGIDISKPMLAAARRRAEESDLPIEYIEADASTHPFAPRYDLLFSRFGVMFFADPVAGFANLRHSLKPNGRLAFVTWRAFAENRWALVPYRAAEHLLPPQQATDPHAPGPFAFADGERLKSILTRAGFHDVKLEKLETTMNMGATTEHAAKEALLVGPLARAATDLPEETRTRILAVVVECMKQFVTPAGVTPPAACWLVRSRA